MSRPSLITSAAALAFLVATPGLAPADEFAIVTPSAPGTGWDQLAQALRTAMADDLRRGDVQVTNVPGASGTVGLAQFTATAGERDLLVTGLTMLDASLVGRTPATLDGLTPIARLTVDDYVLAVPTASPIRSLDDLRSAIGGDGAAPTWGGGPLGGVDHAGTLALLEALGIGPERLSYAPFLSSGDAAAEAADGKVAVAFLALGDVRGEVKAGRLRLLATASPDRVADTDAPTLAEAGVPFEWANWRGIMAKPNLAKEKQAKLAATLQAVTATASWAEMLGRRQWRNAFLGPDAFGAFLKAERARLKSTLKRVGLLKQAPTE